MTKAIHVYSIERTTDKAYLFMCSVSWGNGAQHQKALWFPKSQVDDIDMEQGLAYVSDWCISNTEKKHAYHGYVMTIE